MSSSQSVNDLLMGGGGPPAAKFEKVGDVAKGTITNLDQMQARDFVSNEPKFYDDGKPIMQVVITIKPDDSDEEQRIFLKPSAKTAVKDAVKAAGAEGLDIGGRIAVQFSGEEPAERPGLNPKKLFTAQYKAPEKSINAGDLI